MCDRRDVVRNFITFLFFFFSSHSRTNDFKMTNVTKLCSLIAILHLIAACKAADVMSQNTVDNEDRREGRTLQNISEISDRLLQIRGLLKQLFWDWNSHAEEKDDGANAGESEIEGIVKKMINISI